MARKINIVGARPKKIEVVDQPKRRINPAELAAALGANPSGRQAPGSLDPIALAELGTQLLDRLRSSGGRPALADATAICRVPLSAEDVKTLENMVAQIGESTGAKPSSNRSPQTSCLIVYKRLRECRFFCGPRHLLVYKAWIKHRFALEKLSRTYVSTRSCTVPCRKTLRKTRESNWVCTGKSECLG
jgi:hypothetical protein